MTESKGKAFDCFKCDHNSEKAKHEIMCEVLLSGVRGIIYIGDDDVMRCYQYDEKSEDRT